MITFKAVEAFMAPMDKIVANIRFCRKHYAQFEHGIIDTDGNKLRELRGRRKNG